MNTSRPRFLPSLVASLSLLLLPDAQADDWPQWRGPQRDGVWRETGILEAIPAAGLPIRWRTKVGAGYSGPVVAQGRVFVNDHQFEPEVERIVCFDEATGRELWVHSYPTTYKDMEYGNGPRAAPTVHDGKVYTLGTQGHVVCLDAAKGELVWKKHLVDDLHGQIPRYGASAAPLVVGDLVIVCAGAQPDGSVVALDRLTGEVRWSKLPDRPAYSAPILIRAAGVEQLIVWTADSIASLQPATGQIFWQVPWKAQFDPAQMVASPVRYKDRVLFLGAWSRGSKMLKLDAEKPAAAIAWETGAKPNTTISTPLFQDDDYFYAILGNGSLACLEAATGNEVWTSREATSGSFGNVHFTPNGDRVFLFNHTGHLILARLTKEGYRELGRCLLIEPTAGYRAQGPITWAHPAYANKHVFARNDRELVCASLAADPSIATTATAPEQPAARVLADFEKNAALGLAFSPDSKTLAAATWSGEVKILDASTGQALPGPKPHNDWACSVAFSPDGKFLVSAGGSEFKPQRNGGKTTGQIKLWDRAAEKETGEFTGHTNKVFTAAFSPDSKTLATASADETVRLWDMATRQERAVLRGHKDAVWSVAFSPDGAMVASAGVDRTVRLWDAATGTERATLRGHEDEVRCVAFSPDGKTLASGGADWTVRLWDIPAQKERAVLKGFQGAVQCLAFFPDGTLVTGCGDEMVKFWDVATGRERTVLRGHRSGISAIAISPDQRLVASGGMDDAVRLWTVSNSPKVENPK